MVRLYLAAYILLTCLCSRAQIFTCVDGVTKFTSEAPLELIKAESHRTTGVIDCNSKSVAFSVDINTFEGFNSELQKEHFRENYMETHKYPKAIFRGKIIENIDFTKTGVTTVRAKGVFAIHGVEKERIVNVKVHVADKSIDVDTAFEVPLEDHNIKIPRVVNQKISSVINVKVSAMLKPKS